MAWPNGTLSDTSDKAVWAGAFAEVILLCFWAAYLTIIMSLFQFHTVTFPRVKAKGHTGT